MYNATTKMLINMQYTPTKANNNSAFCVSDVNNGGGDNNVVDLSGDNRYGSNNNSKYKISNKNDDDNTVASNSVQR